MTKPEHNITIDRALQTVGGILLTICFGLSGWALNTVQAQEGRIIKLETELSGVREMLKEVRSDVKEVKSEITKRPH